MSASPLILDLDGDGIEITQHTGAITFDHDANGIETGTAWAGADDGLLVLDRDGNGNIDTGRELFGNNTLLANGQKAADGYAALRELDANADGVLDASDAAFANLRVWRDLDQDGNSDAGELFSLNEVGVSQIGLSKAAFSQTLADGTRLDGLGSFVIDGQTRSYTDAWFAENPFYREFASDIELSQDVAALPGMKGAGAVRDLQEAAMLSQPLRDLLEQFQAATTREAQRALVEPIMAAWAATSDFLTTAKWHASGHAVQYSFHGADATGTAMWTQRLAVLEAFNAQNYVSLHPSGITSVLIGSAKLDLLHKSHDALYDSVYRALALQTRLKPYLDSIELVIGDEGVSFDTSGITALALAKAASDPYNALADLLDLRRYGGDTLQPVGWVFEEALADTLANVTITPDMQALLASERVAWIGDQTSTYTASAAEAGFIVVGNALDNVLTGSASGTERILGGEGNDTLIGIGQGDLLDGGAGDDVLKLSNAYGGATFVGGRGNDTITGGYYPDLYHFELGDGQDTLTDFNSFGSGYHDTIRFGPGIAATDMSLARVGLDLVVSHSNGSDRITVKNWFAHDHYQIERLEFANGEVWTKAQINTQVLEVFGTAGNDNLSGVSGFADVMHGGAGDDVLSGGGGGDRLYGEDGNDTLIAGGPGDRLEGGAGDDVLRFSGSTSGVVFVGGTGNDNMTGGSHSDTYIFNRGDGADTIADNGNHTNSLYADRIVFGQGIVAGDIGAHRVGNDLVVLVAGEMGEAGDQIAIKNWFVDAAGRDRIEQLVFADGTTWVANDLAQLALLTSNTGTAGDDTLMGTKHYSERLRGGDGNDTLIATGNWDVLEGGAGDDVLRLATGTGSDSDQSTTFIGGTGNDTITGGLYKETYVFNRGDGSDTITDHGNNSTNSLYTDKLVFGQGIADEELWFSRSGNDLLVQVLGDGGRVEINDWYASADKRIEEMHLSDGQKLLFNQVDSLVNAMAAFAPPAPGQTTLTPEQQTALAPVIAAAWN